MLRITPRLTPSGASLLVLEGRIVGPWVEVLRSVLAGSDGPTELDLSAVEFVDEDGIVLLRSVLDERTTIGGASAFVGGLLGSDHGGGHGDEH